MFNLFKKRTDAEMTRYLIITAATNFGLVVIPNTKEPLMFSMEPTDTVLSCIQRNAPYVATGVDIAQCKVIEFAATVPNKGQAPNKFFALIVSDPGVLINQNMVLVGYEEIKQIPGPTSSLVQLLVKQTPNDYFAEQVGAEAVAMSQLMTPSATETPQIISEFVKPKENTEPPENPGQTS